MSDELATLSVLLFQVESAKIPITIEGQFIDGSYWYSVEVAGQHVESGDLSKAVAEAFAALNSQTPRQSGEQK